MLISSSRSPSPPTRTLCKYLASFFNCKYVTRGKSGLQDILYDMDTEILLIVGQYHGNPASLTFFDSEGQQQLSIWMNVVFHDKPQKSSLKNSIPSIIGRGKLAGLLGDLLPESGNNSRCSIQVADDLMSFYCNDNNLFNLKIKGFKTMDD
ncbi:rRNA maturation protein [Methanohalophilus mahii]|uniref:Probable Brix domain-containing ribosomal biogenesis protein n=1 Tax=Methanohalophilus mahii (strain ATCC 35705 / DSM 5219 / SLP) TaxID=547558 RepID=D5EAX2_METMS|nr:rRNA maturation protein [Methanohalophilus mahii]ADE36323.1 exosome subunit/U3 small nucleolar ribonucleoprotein (snoRNP) component contains IMP4 domain [Methanohalophilus mahii DSM 5219]